MGQGAQARTVLSFQLLRAVWSRELPQVEHNPDEEGVGTVLAAASVE